MTLVVVTLYGRPDCHLCDEARDLLEGLRTGGQEFELRELDIERDDELLAAFLERIPVIEVGGEVVSELRPDRDAIVARLATVGA